MQATNNCSSHGTCILKSRSRAGEDSSKPVECWTCKCGRTVTTQADGKEKVTYWSGPACQKKDVSVPFWLLAGISIMLVSFVSYGIGLLISVGDSELPSVLSAGVSSSRSK